MNHKIIYNKSTTDLILKLYTDGFSVSKIVNLEFISWQENIKKRTKCSITIEELKLS